MSQSTESRKSYVTDLTDQKWAIIEPLLPVPKNPHGGRPRRVSLREVINAIVYLNRAGRQWDLLPHDSPPKSTVYDYFSTWQDNGTWAIIVSALRTRIREIEGRESTPSAMCIDSQATKTTEVGGDDRGYDDGKKIKGRKRHLLVDTLGLLVAVVITGANVDDGTAASQVVGEISPEEFPRLRTIFGDNKYNNTSFQAWLVRERPGWQVEVQSRPPGSVGFQPVRIPLGGRAEQRLAWSQSSQQQGFRTPPGCECRHDPHQPSACDAPPTRTRRATRIQVQKITAKHDCSFRIRSPS